MLNGEQYYYPSHLRCGGGWEGEVDMKMGIFENSDGRFVRLTVHDIIKVVQILSRGNNQNKKKKKKKKTRRGPTKV